MQNFQFFQRHCCPDLTRVKGRPIHLKATPILRKLFEILQSSPLSRTGKLSVWFRPSPWALRHVTANHFEMVQVLTTIRDNSHPPSRPMYLHSVILKEVLHPCWDSRGFEADGTRELSLKLVQEFIVEQRSKARNKETLCNFNEQISWQKVEKNVLGRLYCIPTSDRICQLIIAAAENVGIRQSNRDTSFVLALW